MAISDTLDDAKGFLKDIQKKYKFKKANAARADAVELQASLAKCRGKLEICQKDFNRTIKTQSKNISEGQRIGADTIIQEQILWDAAIGYMLVRDAIYSLKTINSYDSVSHAYEMLDAASKQMAGKKGGLPGFKRIGSTKERNSYGYITSATAVKDKEELLDSFFERLKVTGDIEECLTAARNPAARQAELRGAYTGGVISSELSGASAGAVSELDDMMSRLSGVPDAESTEDDFAAGLDAMMDIHPPTDGQ